MEIGGLLQQLLLPLKQQAMLLNVVESQEVVREYQVTSEEETLVTHHAGLAANVVEVDQ